MYEGSEIRSNRAQGAIAGQGFIGQGYPSQDTAPAAITAMPIDQAVNDLEREIACLWEQVGMLLGRLSPICKPLPKDAGNTKGVPAYCQLEGRINASKEKVTEIYLAVSAARDALCI